ncbi:MAG: hypothetical protein ABOK23_01705 [Candidatus Methanoperedens sp.]|nr:hypothetical protein [Candidatus Methanoperedens sp.]MCZ7395448.1 hypothetical protein [Candidatus Methanoperedens sp.]
MKKQYLGDERDLFKFDLIKEIIQGINTIERFTYIPMLTRYDSEYETHGNQRNLEKAIGNLNTEFVAVLKKYEFEPIIERNFDRIKEYFKKLGNDVKFYKENETFTDDARVQYFKNIPHDLLSKSLVFVDPDTGLQSKSPSEKHILYWEVSYLYDQMDDDSLLMIYQHSKHRPFSQVKRKLETNITNSSIYISDKSIALFFLAKNGISKEDLRGILKEYTKKYPDLEVK